MDIPKGHNFRIDTDRGRFYAWMGWDDQAEAEKKVRWIFWKAGHDSGVEFEIKLIKHLKRDMTGGPDAISWFPDRPPVVGRAFMEALGRGEEFDRNREEMISKFERENPDLPPGWADLMRERS